MEETLEWIKAHLSYEPATGNFFWRLSGQLVEPTTVKGYPCIYGPQGRIYLHRAAFVLMLGGWPVYEVDHQDRNRSNNVWTNLQDATPKMQANNRGMRNDNKSGIKGLYWAESRQRWVVQGPNNKTLGRFIFRGDAEQYMRDHNLLKEMRG